MNKLNAENIQLWRYIYSMEWSERIFYAAFRYKTSKIKFNILLYLENPIEKALTRLIIENMFYSYNNVSPLFGWEILAHVIRIQLKWL